MEAVGPSARLATWRRTSVPGLAIPAAPPFASSRSVCTRSGQRETAQASPGLCAVMGVHCMKCAHFAVLCESGHRHCRLANRQARPLAHVLSRTHQRAEFPQQSGRRQFRPCSNEVAKWGMDMGPGPPGHLKTLGLCPRPVLDPAGSPGWDLPGKLPRDYPRMICQIGREGVPGSNALRRTSHCALLH